MRDSVRRLCSPLTASKPSPIAISGTRKERNETNDGSGSRARGEQAQEQERVLRRGFLDLLDGAVERRERDQHDQPFEHAHAHAGQMVGQLLEHDDAETLKGRAFTLHVALLLWRLPRLGLVSK